MANYTFQCKKCGEFTLWYQGMHGNKQEAACPDCNTAAKRVFKPPITFRIDSRVKHTIEQGMEPKVVKREALPKQIRKPSVSRPWQAGH